MAAALSWLLAMAAAAVLLLPPPAARACTYESGVAYGGGASDLAVAPPAAAESREACCLACRAAAGCLAFTLGGGLCVLKKNVVGPTPNASATSGVATGVCTPDVGYEYPLFDISTIPGIANPQMCCYWCSATIKCVAFSFFKSGPNSGQCRLKYALNNAVASPNVVAGTRSGTTCTYEEGFDIRGFNLQTLTNIATKQACCTLCSQNSKCFAFTYTYSGAQAKTCILKTSRVNRIPNADVISASSTGSPCVAPPATSTAAPPPQRPPPKRPPPIRRL